MIKRFHVLYVGQIELDNIGLDGTPSSTRCPVAKSAAVSRLGTKSRDQRPTHHS